MNDLQLNEAPEKKLRATIQANLRRKAFGFSGGYFSSPPPPLPLPVGTRGYCYSDRKGLVIQRTHSLSIVSPPCPPKKQHIFLNKNNKKDDAAEASEAGRERMFYPVVESEWRKQTQQKRLKI